MQHIFHARFSETSFVAPNSQSWGSDLNQIWRVRRSLALPTWVSDFRCTASFWNYSASKDNTL